MHKHLRSALFFLGLALALVGAARNKDWMTSAGSVIATLASF